MVELNTVTRWRNKRYHIFCGELCLSSVTRKPPGMWARTRTSRCRHVTPEWRSESARSCRGYANLPFKVCSSPRVGRITTTGRNHSRFSVTGLRGRWDAAVCRRMTVLWREGACVRGAALLHLCADRSSKHWWVIRRQPRKGADSGQTSASRVGWPRWASPLYPAHASPYPGSWTTRGGSTSPDWGCTSSKTVEEQVIMPLCTNIFFAFISGLNILSIMNMRFFIMSSVLWALFSIY